MHLDFFHQRNAYFIRSFVILIVTLSELWLALSSATLFSEPPDWRAPKLAMKFLEGLLDGCGIILPRHDEQPQHYLRKT